MFTFFWDLVSEERVQPAPRTEPGPWRLPGGADGLQHDGAQRAGENWRAGRPDVSGAPGQLAPPALSRALLSQPSDFYCAQRRLAFFC